MGRARPNQRKPKTRASRHVRELGCSIPNEHGGVQSFRRVPAKLGTLPKNPESGIPIVNIETYIMETQVKTDRRKLWSYFDKKNHQHQYILSLCIQYGWTRKHPVRGIDVADLGALDRWLRGKAKSGQSPVQKPLNEMNRIELSRVISAMEKMITKKFMK